MKPKDIKNNAVEALQNAVVKMSSPEWGDTEEEREALDEARKKKLRLENAALAKITKGLVANEKALTKGKKDLDDALTNLTDVKNVIDNVTAFIKIVVRVLEAVGPAAA